MIYRELLEVRLRRERSHGKVRRKNSYFPSCLPMTPRAPQPSLQSSQKHINSDWARV